MTRYKFFKESEMQYSRTELEALISSIEGIDNVNIFAACFCKEPDLLSQWRGYSGGMHGYSIGFDVRTLRDASDQSELMLGKCIYDRGLQEKIIDEAIEKCLSSSISLPQVLFRCGLFFKDSAFREEQEWRLVSPATRMTAVRKGKSMLVPYLNLKIRQDDRPFIRCVCIGPCPHPDLSTSAVRLWLLTTGAGIPTVPAGISRGPDVRLSSIPFRDW